MKKYLVLLIILWSGICFTATRAQSAGQKYLSEISQEMKVKWPKNRTINLVFHGHSVPSGYFVTPNVNKINSYPVVALKKIKEKFPYAVINSITTSIGGEHAEKGANRLKRDVLNHKPDVLFIDYALNDRSLGLTRAKKAWEKMITEAKKHTFTGDDGKKHKIKIVLMTPTPDLNEKILSDSSLLFQHATQIRQLAKKHKVGLFDSFGIFRNIARKKGPINSYMAQKNHINQKGHTAIGNAIATFFSPDIKGKKASIPTGGGLNVNVYPTPSKGMVTIERTTAAPLLLEIFDISGKLITEYNIEESKETLQLHKVLGTGVYVLKFSNSLGTQSKRFIIE